MLMIYYELMGGAYILYFFKYRVILDMIKL